jgi:hypothetical protein
MNALIKNISTTGSASDEAVDVAIYGSLTRILESHIPIEKRLGVFQLMTRTAARDLERRRQQYVVDLNQIADNVGLVPIIGTTTVAEVIAAEFGR